jgi:hypothetical protein
MWRLFLLLDNADLEFSNFGFGGANAPLHPRWLRCCTYYSLRHVMSDSWKYHVGKKEKRVTEINLNTDREKCVVQWLPKSAPRTTGGPRDWLKWSANPYINRYFVLRGPPIFFKCSTNQKSLETTGVVR